MCLLSTAVACGAPVVRTTGVEQRAIQSAQTSAVAYEQFIQAEHLADLGYWNEAAEALRIAISADPQAPRLHLRLARALAETEDGLREGLMACDLALSLDADPAEVAIHRAALHRAAQDVPSAIAVFESVPPEAVSIPMFQAWTRLAYLAADPGVARARAGERYAEAFPERSAAWRTLGDALVDTNPARAAEAYGRAITLPDPNPEDAYRRIELLRDLGEMDAALDAAQDCRQRFWEYWPCTSWEVLLLDADRAPEAPVSAATREALEHLAFMVSVDARQLSQSGGELRGEGSDSLVLAYAQVLAEVRPHNANVISTAGWFANSVGAYDVAVEMMQRVLELDDADFDALNYIGYTWAEQGENLEQAEVYIREALFLRGEDGNILDSLAWVYFRMERFEDALEVQLRAVDLVEDNAVVWDHLGDIYHALGRTDEAIDAWERALEFADDFAEDVAEDAARKLREARPVGQSKR